MSLVTAAVSAASQMASEYSEYELLRMRNMQENQLKLASLGLDLPKEPPVIAAPVLAPRPPRQPRERCTVRIASLRRSRTRGRDGSTPSRPALRSTCVRRASFDDALRRIRGERQAATPVGPTPRRGVRGSADRRGPGGWNAGAGVGTAVVIARAGGDAHRVTIRKRPDGRLYGYVGRTQINIKGTDSFPCMVSGINVLCYEADGFLA